MSRRTLAGFQAQFQQAGTIPPKSRDPELIDEGKASRTFGGHHHDQFLEIHSDKSLSFVACLPTQTRAPGTWPMV